MDQKENNMSAAEMTDDQLAHATGGTDGSFVRKCDYCQQETICTIQNNVVVCSVCGKKVIIMGAQPAPATGTWSP